MKLEQPELPLLFSETVVPDIFFAEYLSQMPATCVKVYLYMIFLSKYNKDIKLNDMSRKFNLLLSCKIPCAAHDLCRTSRGLR